MRNEHTICYSHLSNRDYITREGQSDLWLTASEMQSLPFSGTWRKGTDKIPTREFLLLTIFQKVIPQMRNSHVNENLFKLNLKSYPQPQSS